MAVAIIEFLEIIDIEHGDGIGLSKILQRVDKRLSAGKSRQRIVVCKRIGCFQSERETIRAATQK